MNGWMNEWMNVWMVFQAIILHCNATLFQGQHGLMRGVLIWTMPQMQYWSLDLLTCSPACYTVPWLLIAFKSRPLQHFNLCVIESTVNVWKTAWKNSPPYTKQVENSIRSQRISHRKNNINIANQFSQSKIHSVKHTTSDTQHRYIKHSAVQKTSITL